MLNYYTILRIQETASTEEIKSAYRALAKQYHPDLNPNNSIAEEYFKKINEAHSVLSDPIKRNWYNLMLKGNQVRHQVDPRKYGTRKSANPFNSSSNNSFETEEESSTPFWLKQLVYILAMLWALLVIYNNWFVTYEGYEVAKVVMAFLFFVVVCYFYINILYNRWRLGNPSFNPESRSLRWFLLIFFLTIPAFFILGMARKSIQLQLYPKYTEGRIITYERRANAMWVSVLYFDEYNNAFMKELKFVCGTPIKNGDYKIQIKYSSLEPRIMKYHVLITNPLPSMQENIDEVNRGGDYFIPEN